MKKKISQSQLILPLLDAIEERGGAAKVRDIYDLVAEKVDLPPNERAARITISGQTYNAFEREVRWAQQRAKLQGLLRPADAGLWALTDKGQSALTKATPGIVVTIFMTDKGAALWGHCEDAVGLLDDNSLSLVFSSPPYPLLRKKEYGNLDERGYRQFNQLKAKRLTRAADQRPTETPVTSAQAVKARARDWRQSAALEVAGRRKRFAT
jgi:hypothetical protein